jgi:iron complex transport system permease protein
MRLWRRSTGSFTKTKKEGSIFSLSLKDRSLSNLAPHSGRVWVIPFLTLFLLVLFFLGLGVGSLPFGKEEWISILLSQHPKEKWEILLHFRIPREITAVVTGGSLSIAGLYLQTYFKNPLASPELLGIQGISAFGLTLTLVLTNTTYQEFFTLPPLLGSFLLSVLYFFLLLLVHPYFTPVGFLLFGLLFQFLLSALTQILFYFLSPENLTLFQNWAMGSFTRLSLNETFLFASLLLLCTGGMIPLTTPLNRYLLGEEYAVTMGISLRELKFGILLLTGGITTLTTSACGPIAFVGVAIPHLSRMVLLKNDHRLLLPTTFLLGGTIALGADLLQRFPRGGIVLPINALLALVGIPIVLWTFLKNRLSWK